jgi:hypothetical protein
MVPVTTPGSPLIVQGDFTVLVEVVVLPCGAGKTVVGMACMAVLPSSTLGARVQRLTPTLLDLAAVTAAERAALTRRLRAAGIFLGDRVDPSTRASAAPHPRRGRRR